MVLVSGRSTAGARAVARMDVDAIVGNHGADILRASRLRPWLGGERRVVRNAALLLNGLTVSWPRVRVEEKEHSLAVHFRETPRAGRLLLRAARALLQGGGLQVRLGNRVLDVRASGADKGTAVKRWLATAEHGRVPLEEVLYAGDDTTDEDAFRALGRRAVTIAVGRRPRYARFRTAGPASFARWLGRLADARQRSVVGRESGAGRTE